MLKLVVPLLSHRIVLLVFYYCPKIRYLAVPVIGFSLQFTINIKTQISLALADQLNASPIARKLIFPKNTQVDF